MEGLKGNRWQRYYDSFTGRFLREDPFEGNIDTPPSLHRYLYANVNPLIYVDRDGSSAYLATGAEFDDFGAQLYADGNKVGAFAVAVGGAAYKSGTGFFTAGLFDEANQAITDNDTFGGAAKQFGGDVADTAIEVVEDYVQEGIIVGTAKAAGKLACGRMRQACSAAIEAGERFAKKFDVDNRTNSGITSGRSKPEQGSLKDKKADGPGSSVGTGNADALTISIGPNGKTQLHRAGDPPDTFRDPASPDRLRAAEKHSQQTGSFVSDPNRPLVNVSDNTHKNSLSYVGDTHVYRIKGSDGTYKIGESTQGVRKHDGASIRAEQQVRELQRETGEIYESKILKDFPDKRSAVEYQNQLRDRFRQRYGEDTLPGNLEHLRGNQN